MSRIAKVVYTAKTETTGGREKGASRSSDGRLDIRFSIPGSARIGANPEQLLAAGWSASFASAITVAARERGIVLPAEVRIDAEIDLIIEDGRRSLGARLKAVLPGLDCAVAKAIIAEAANICPYSKAMRGNIDIAITLA